MLLLSPPQIAAVYAYLSSSSSATADLPRIDAVSPSFPRYPSLLSLLSARSPFCCGSNARVCELSESALHMRASGELDPSLRQGVGRTVPKLALFMTLVGDLSYTLE
jgi:hypothetical protein